MQCDSRKRLSVAAERWVVRWLRLLHDPDKSHLSRLVAARATGSHTASAILSRHGGVGLGSVSGSQECPPGSLRGLDSISREIARWRCRSCL